VGDKIENVGDKVQCVDEKVQVVIDGARGLSGQCLKPSNVYTFRQHASKSSGTGNKVGYSTGGRRHRRNQVFVASQLRHCSPLMPQLAGNQLIQLLRSWLAPADPSTNHNIARKAQHNGTAAWLFQGQIIIKWKSTGSLLWIHGKRAFLLLFPASDF
jgi:hypothetical protein